MVVVGVAVVTMPHECRASQVAGLCHWTLRMSGSHHCRTDGRTDGCCPKLQGVEQIDWATPLHPATSEGNGVELSPDCLFSERFILWGPSPWKPEPWLPRLFRQSCGNSFNSSNTGWKYKLINKHCEHTNTLFVYWRVCMCGISWCKSVWTNSPCIWTPESESKSLLLHSYCPNQGEDLYAWYLNRHIAAMQYKVNTLDNKNK